MYCTNCNNFEEKCTCGDDANLTVIDECDECGYTFFLEDLNYDNLCEYCEE